MTVKIKIHSCLLVLAGSLLIGLNPVQATDQTGFSVGHDSLKSSKDDPKSKNIGAIKAKYGFGASKEITSYIGTGLAYSYSEESKPGEAAFGIKTGVAGQAGINYLLGGKFSLNLDYQYLHLQPDLKSGISGPATQKVGIGLDIKF